MSRVEDNSRALLTFVKDLVVRFINVATSLLAVAEYGGPFATLLMATVKLRLLDLYISLGALDGLVGGWGDGGVGGNILLRPRSS